ncbi:leucine rich repeat gene family protein [Alphaentomopoxvirus acuprea]|uniref:Leucine-rich repeat gene family protein n=1 Tax=Alphaentomopoxvirus acuprea TaxID=62099 RepID=W6JIJ4_9POXV|nr:leucine-rich repeat gene family protein [Anomala cuprea entomopoxvirus]YP_009001719.1 leucine rich repeat gene family protein [Anomala cuprea entomopoxvirus]BAO49378.1 leucine-rich repeat gene family protein [Anomala cuprea entomopoxvirus]BAO49606.1 leucine rich repeat gene family protein [Anomala cuprea entomopoxvirus]
MLTYLKNKYYLRNVNIMTALLLLCIGLVAGYDLELLDYEFKYINEHTFSPTSITINNTNIDSIYPRAFRYVQRVTYISITYSKLTYITHENFANLKHLNYLSLAHNSISVIHPYAFKTNTKLYSLVLSHNPFISSTFIYPLVSNIRTLDLSYCNITSLNNYFFYYLTNLIILNLSNNKITQIYDISLYTTRLVNLNLAYNPLITLDNIPDTIVNLIASNCNINTFDKYFKNLKYLDLYGNNITNIDTDQFRKYKDLNTFYFQYNDTNEFSLAMHKMYIENINFKKIYNNTLIVNNKNNIHDDNIDHDNDDNKIFIYANINYFGISNVRKFRIKFCKYELSMMRTPADVYVFEYRYADLHSRKVLHMHEYNIYGFCEHNKIQIVYFDEYINKYESLL